MDLPNKKDDKTIWIRKSFDIDTSNWPEKIKAFFQKLFKKGDKEDE